MKRKPRLGAPNAWAIHSFRRRNTDFDPLTVINPNQVECS